MDPEYTYSIKTQVIDGSSYLLIPMGEGVEVNGIDVTVNASGPEDGTEE